MGTKEIVEKLTYREDNNTAINMVVDKYSPKDGEDFGHGCQLNKEQVAVSFLINSNTISICIENKATYILDKDVCRAILEKLKA